jgi:predicted ABC-type exoprotein transport system permease subunit
MVLHKTNYAQKIYMLKKEKSMQERRKRAMILSVIAGKYNLVIALFLGILMFAQFYRKTMWLVRWPTAVLIGSAIAINITSGTQANVVGQLSPTFGLA